MTATERKAAEAYCRALSEDDELWQERAAIREFDAGIQRSEAERLAREDVRRILTEREGRK